MWRVALCLALHACSFLLSHGHQGCATLKNRNSYYTVPVLVGNPPQTLNAVVDTSSQNVVVPDCKCTQSRKCVSERCYDQEKSRSFLDVAKHLGGSVPTVLLTHGAGEMEAYPINDFVQVAGVSHKMEEALFVMSSSSVHLGPLMPFEGLFGLGIPTNPNKLERVGGKLLTKKVDGGTNFMEQAGIKRFSVCYGNDGTDVGSLMFGMPPLKNPMSSIHKSFWSLHLRHIYVGHMPMDEVENPFKLKAKLNQVPTCMLKDTDSKQDGAASLGQVTTCGAIPDSSATSIQGPPEGVMRLQSSICQSWKRCADNAEFKGMSLTEAFEKTLYQCQDWIHESAKGINEVPSLHFVVEGKNLHRQTVVVPATSYIVQVMSKGPAGPRSVVVRNRCHASLAKTMYTEGAKPAWIMGAPVFHSYKVSFDRREPPAMAFIRGRCDSCNGQRTQLKLHAGGSKTRDLAFKPREVEEFILSKINMTTF